MYPIIIISGEIKRVNSTPRKREIYVTIWYNMKMNSFFYLKISLFTLLFWSILSPVFSQTSFDQGEAFFVQNQPQEALEFLEAAVFEDPDHVQAFLYLGIVNQQLGRIDDAIIVYQSILPRILAAGGTETARVAFNLGNAYFLNGEVSLAINSFTQALEAEPEFSAALLNRANAQVQQGSLEDAVADYELYLLMEPDSPQYMRIEQLISFIHDEFAAEEQARLAAEDMVRQEEERWQRFIYGIAAASFRGLGDDSLPASENQEDEPDIEVLDIDESDIEESDIEEPEPNEEE